MRYTATIVLLGIQTGKAVAAPINEPFDAENLGDALHKMGQFLQDKYNNDLIRAIAVEVKESQ